MPNSVPDYNQYPVRAHLKGVVSKNGQNQPFETIYDFYQYNPILTGNERNLLQVIFNHFNFFLKLKIDLFYSNRHHQESFAKTVRRLNQHQKPARDTFILKRSFKMKALKT